MNVLRRLYRYIGRYKAWAVVAFGSMIVFAATHTILIALTQPIVDQVLSKPGQAQVQASPSTQDRFANTILRRDKPEGQRGWLINTFDRTKNRIDTWWNEKPKDKWRKVLIAILVLFIIRGFAAFFSEYGFQKVGLSTVRDLRNQLYEHIINQSHKFFADRSTGEMVSRLVSDADQIQAAVSTRMGDLFQESITLVGLLLYVLISNTELALISFVVAPLLVWPVVHFGLRLRRTTHRSQERMADMAIILEETIRGVRIVKAFTMEKFEIGRFR